MSVKTVGIVVVSTDVLEGKKCDTASKFLVKEFNSLLYSVAKLSVVPEKESLIVLELDSLIKSCDVVVAVGEKCGAIYRAISGKMSQGLRYNSELATILKKEPFDEEEVLLPVQAKVMNSVYPVVHFQRIFILKEKHLKQCFSKVLRSHLTQYIKERSYSKTVQVNLNGNSISDLNEIMKLANNGVRVELSKSDQFAVFKLSSADFAHLVEFELKIRKKFESYCLHFIDNSDVWENVYSSDERHVKNAIETIEGCLEQYGLENIFLSFNGGKDCTVLLHLVLTVIKKKYPLYTQPLLCMYVQSESPFPEQDEFINQSQLYYNLKIITIKSGIKEALQQTLQTYPNYKACFMGTRRTDPYSSDLNLFQMTDGNWPQIMRVSPLLDWHYSDIWDYLLYYKVPYCKLYDMGFTSLGNTVNTTRNPSLIYYDQFEEKEVYLPAYKLLNETKERNGRNSNLK